MTKKSLWLVLGTLVVVGLVLGGCTLLTDQTGINQSKNQLVPLDELEWEGDTITPPTVFLSIGPAAVGATVEADIILYIERKGNVPPGNNVFANSAVVTITFDKAESDDDLKDAAVTPLSQTITLPLNWTSQPWKTLAGPVTFKFEFTIPAGFNFNKTYVLHFEATGLGYKGSQITREENVQIKFYQGETPPPPPPTYSISGAKWYDRNKSGTWDNDEPGIQGWLIELYDGGWVPLDDTYTGSNGAYTFTGLLAGTYMVKEGAVSGNWVQTYPTNPNYHTVTISNADVTGKDFGNVCEITARGGYTLGFWSNRNGQNSLRNGWTAYLTGYNLVNKNGTAFDPTGYSGFKTWLLRVDSVNMSYMLSVQLAATLLNIQYKGANYDGLGIVVDGTWTSIADVITAANSFLGLNPITRDGHPQRALAEFYKNVFDGLNNNRLKLIPYNPCPLPVWP